MTFTKERLEEIAEDGFLKHGESKALARIALASLEAEHVSFDDLRDAVAEVSGGPAMEWSDIYKGHQAVPFINFNSLARIVDKFRTAPPAHVSAPDLLEQFAEFMAAESIKSGDYPDGWQSKASNAAHEYAQNIRAAMLQGAAQPQNAQQNIPENIPTLREGVAAIRNSGIAIDAEKIQAERDALNEPVHGWIPCSERMPDPDSKFRVCAYTPSPHEDLRYRFVPASLFKSVCRDATHWKYMQPPAAPQQEVKSGR